MRSEAYGENRALSPVDHFGVWLSSRAVLRNAVFDGMRVADFGCGYDASFARRILPRVRRMLLVDVHLAEDLKRHPKVDAIDGPLEAVLPAVASGSLDIVICLSVLEHLDDPQQALDDLRRILVPGGIALINVPSWRGRAWLELSAFRLGLEPGLRDRRPPALLRPPGSLADARARRLSTERHLLQTPQVRPQHVRGLQCSRVQRRLTPHDEG